MDIMSSMRKARTADPTSDLLVRLHEVPEKGRAVVAVIGEQRVEDGDYIASVGVRQADADRVGRRR